MINQLDIKEIAEKYLQTLVHDRDEKLLELVGDGAAIDDPRKGRVIEDDAILQFAHDTKVWLEYREPRVQYLRTTVTDERVCCESMLHMQSQGESLSLPVGVVVSKHPETGAAEVHVYHTMWPIKRRHTVRQTLFSQPVSDGHHAGVISKYFQGLVEGDLEKVMETMEADVYFREASGPPYIHWGHAPVAEYFKWLFSCGAPMIRGETIFDDGRCEVMEFTAFGWNGVEWDPSKHEAGLAVYERSEEGLIRAIRIYDDIDFT